MKFPLVPWYGFASSKVNSEGYNSLHEEEMSSMGQSLEGR